MDLEVKLKELESAVAQLESVLAEKEKTIESLTEENKRLDKALTIEREKAMSIELKAREEREQKVAESIMNRILEASQIPERLYGKIKGQIDYRAFRTDEEFTPDSESAKKFADAFKTEVEDWSSVLSHARIGLSEPKRESGIDENDAFTMAKAETDEILGIK